MDSSNAAETASAACRGNRCAAASLPTAGPCIARKTRHRVAASLSTLHGIRGHGGRSATRPMPQSTHVHVLDKLIGGELPRFTSMADVLAFEAIAPYSERVA